MSAKKAPHRLRVSYNSTRSRRSAREIQEKEKVKQIYDNIREKQLYNIIYGPKEIISRIDELETHPVFTQTHEGPLNPPPDLETIPICPLKLDDEMFELTSAKPQTARYSIRLSKRLNKDSQVPEIQALQNEPIPKLFIPSSRQFHDRTIKTARVGMRRLNSAQAPFQDLPEEKIENVIIEPVMREKSVLPLYFFDDESYDTFLFEDLLRKLHYEPIIGYSLYSFDSQTLEWRKCQVLSYNKPYFTIKWEDSDIRKEVNRISLRFDFDDVERFEKRREKAFAWRAVAEKKIKLEAYLNEMAMKNSPTPPVDTMESIIERLTEDISKSDKLQSVIQDVIENFRYSEVTTLYNADWNDPVKVEEYIKMGFDGPSESFKHKTYDTSALPPSRLELHFYSPLAMIELNRQLIELVKSPLYTFKFEKPNIRFEVFFEENNRVLANTVDLITKTLIINLIGTARDFLDEDRIPEVVERTLRMADSKIMDYIEDYLCQGMIDFVYQFSLNPIKFILRLNNHLELIEPEPENIMKAGIDLLTSMRDCLKNKVKSTTFIIDQDRPIEIHEEYIEQYYIEAVLKWKEIVHNAYDRFEFELRQLQECLKDLTLGDVEDVMSNLDLNSLSEYMKNAEQAYNRFNDRYGNEIDIYFLHIDIESFHLYVDCQLAMVRNWGIRHVNKILTSSIYRIGDDIRILQIRCTNTPRTIEEYYAKHILLSDMMTNYKEIYTNLDSNTPYFDFLERFANDSKINISYAYQQKVTLRLILDNLPYYRECEQVEYKRLMEDHKIQIEELHKKINALYNKVQTYPFKVDRDISDQYLIQLNQLKQNLADLDANAAEEQGRDRMMDVEPSQFPMLDKIRGQLNLFIPFWEIIELLNTTKEEWLNVSFLQLNPNELIDTVRQWQKIMIDTCESMAGPPSIIETEFEAGTYTILELGQQIQEDIITLIGHIPIIQHLCNPYFRNRHWVEISQITGYKINPNEGLTWNWVIEIGLEQYLSDIALVSNKANMEIKIEKALEEMSRELRQVSVALRDDDGCQKIDDTTPIFEMLARHQLRIQELFVPPYIKPFAMRTKEYEVLTQNLRQILQKTLEAQASIEDIAPAMESQDIRNQSATVAEHFDESVNTFNTMVNKFGNNNSLFELISNPRYFSIVDNLKGNLAALKEDLANILAEKRRLFPYFRFLSDDQLTEILQHSHEPEVVSYLFGYLYPAVKEATFDNRHKCLGLISMNGEELTFTSPFVVSPTSIETTFQSFNDSVLSTLQSILFGVGNMPMLKLAQKYPVQIAALQANIMFTTKIETIFGSVNGVFDDKKASYFEVQFENYRNFINTEIEQVMTEAQKSPCVQYLNMMLILLKQREIITNLIDNKIDSSGSYEWMKRIRYYSTGKEVVVSIGLNSYNYGFDYTGNSPSGYLSDQIEDIYGSMMTSLTSGFNCLLAGPAYAAKSALIKDFARRVGKNVFIYSVSHNNTEEMLRNIIETAKLTGVFLIFRDIHLLDKNVFLDITDALLPVTKKESANMSHIFGTCSIDEGEKVPAFMKLHFRPIICQPLYYEEIFDAILTSVGLPNNELLCQKLNILHHTFGYDDSSQFYRIFSIQNITKTLLQKSLDPENPTVDIYERFISQIETTIDLDYSIRNQVRTILDVSCEIVDVETPELDSSISPNVREILKLFIESIQFHRNIIILGDALTGKSRLIQKASEISKSSLFYINPYAQDFNIVIGAKAEGILYNYISDEAEPKWVVFDGICHNEWMTLLAVNNTVQEDVFFCDGSHIHLSDTFRFIFETNSIANATPTILSNCATINIKPSTLTIDDFLNDFKDLFMNDSRIHEPLSGTIMGTNHKMVNLLNKISSFCHSIFPALIKIHSNEIISSRYAINDFFRILYAVLSVHYISEFQLSAFKQSKRVKMTENIISHCIFAVTWSFGALYENEGRKIFENELRRLIPKLEVEFNVEDSIYDVFFEPDLAIWKPWEEMGANSFFSTDVSTTDISPEFILLPLKRIIPALYLSDCLLSQNKPVMFDSSSKMLQRTTTKFAINTEYVGVHYQPLLFHYTPGFTGDTLRDIIDQGMAGIRDGSRSVLRMPLLAFHSFEFSNNSFTELIRYAFDHGFITNLQTFSDERTKGLAYVFSGDSSTSRNPNKRLLSHFSIIRIPDFDEVTYVNGIKRFIDIFFNFDASEEIAAAIHNTIKEINVPFHFNYRHIMKYLQRVEIILHKNNESLVTEAFASEAVSMFYDPWKSDETLAKLNIMVRTISKLLQQEPVSVFEISGDRTLSNISSTEFRFVTSFENIQKDSKSEQKELGRHTPSLKRQHSLRSLVSELHQISGKYFRTIDLSKITVPSTTLSVGNQVEMIKIARMLTTPRTHILLVTETPNLANEIVSPTIEMLKFKLTIFTPGDNILETIRNTVFESGKTKTHSAVFINYDTLSRQDAKFLRLFMIDPYLNHMFESNMLLDILTELHCGPDEDDPFREDTLESRDTYNVLVHDLLSDCHTYFHVILAASPNNKDFSTLNKCASAIYIESALNNEIQRLSEAGIQDVLKVDKDCVITEKKLTNILIKLSQIQTIKNVPQQLLQPALRNIVEIFSRFYIKGLQEYEAKYLILSQLQIICQEIQKRLENTMKSQMHMEEEIQKISQQIDEFVDKIKEAEEIAINKKKVIEEEEKILKAQEAQANALQKESEESLAIVRPMLIASTNEVSHLSSRDLSIIKSMNHPPQGVYLVLKAIVVMMTGKPVIEEVSDDFGKLPSWVAGKKLLSDTSFLNKLVAFSLDGLHDSTMVALQPFIDDPNFTPTVVAASSTAAKSICKYIRALVPYYNTMKLCKEKQDLLAATEKKLYELQDKHKDTIAQLKQVNEEFHEIEIKSKHLKVRKANIEEQLIRSKEAFDKAKETMGLMQDFFDDWATEMSSISEQRSILAQNYLFTASCISLYGVLPTSQRDELFEEIKTSFAEQELRFMETRQDLINEFKDGISSVLKQEDVGAVTPQYILENIIMISVNSTKWFTILDRDMYINILLKPIITKRVTILAYNCPTFLNEILICIQRNDFTIIVDYDFDERNPFFHQVYKLRGSTQALEIAGIQCPIPADYQIAFICSEKPMSGFFNSIYIDLNIGDEILLNEMAYVLFTNLDPEVSHQCALASKSLRDADNELKRTRKELQEYVINSSSDLLHDEKVVKQFQAATMTNKRVGNHVNRVTEKYNELSKGFKDYYEKAKPLLKLYNQHVLKGGISRFYDVLQEVMIESEGTNAETSYNNILTKLPDRITEIKAKSLPFDTKIRFLMENNEILSYESSIKSIETKYPKSDIVISPKSVDAILSCSNNKRPIIATISFAMYQALLLSDKIIISPAYLCIDGFNRALKEGKMLVTLVSGSDTFKYLVPLIARIHSSMQLSSDFKLIILTDEPPSEIKYGSYFMENCDYIDINGICDIKRLISMYISSIPYSVFDHSHGMMANRWRRVIMLLVYFDTCVHVMMETVFMSPVVSEHTLSILVSFLTKMTHVDLDLLKKFAVYAVYDPPNSQVIEAIDKLWESIFIPTNLEPVMLQLFGKYSIPLNFTQSSFATQFNQYPTIDDPQVFGMLPFSNSLDNELHVAKWKNIDAKMIKCQFTPITQSECIWYLQSEIEEANRLQDAPLLSMLRAANPIIDLNLLRFPKKLFNILYVKTALRMKWSLKNMGLLIVSVEPDIELSNIALVTGKSPPAINKIIKLKAVEYQENFTCIPLIHKAVQIATLFTTESERATAFSLPIEILETTK